MSVNCHALSKKIFLRDHSLIHSSNSIMAALQGVPLDAPHDPAAPPAALPIARNLIRSRQGFSREVVVEAPLDAEGGITFLDVETLRGAQPHLQELLNNQLRFLVKVVARVRLAETVVDPSADEPAERYSNVWIPLGPWAVPPLARVDERLRRYILRVADHKLQFALPPTLQPHLQLQSDVELAE